MDAHEFDTNAPGAPETLVWGFLQISDLPAAPPARARCYADDDNVAGVSIFGNDPNSPQQTSLVYIKIYRLPAAEKSFAEDLKSESEGAKAIDPWTLAPPNLPAHWRHKAAKTERCIVHAWRGGSRALLIRYFLDAGDHTRLPLFTWAANNIRVINGAWLLDPPVAAGAQAIADTDDGMRDRLLDATEQSQIAANAKRAADHLNVSPMAKPEEVITAIHNDINRLRPQFASFKPNVQNNISILMGNLWGEALCKVTGWQWCILLRPGEGDDGGFLAIASPDRAYALGPVDVMINNLSNNASEAENNSRLLFNMIRAGKLPKSHPNSYTMLS